MGTLSFFSNICTGLFGAVLIMGVFIYTDETVATRLEMFGIGLSFIVLALYVGFLHSSTELEWWQTSLVVTSVIIGIIFVIMVIVVVWVFMTIMKMATDELGG